MQFPYEGITNNNLITVRTVEDAQAKIVSQEAALNNAQQTQTILNTMGRFVAWAGSGTQTTSTT